MCAFVWFRHRQKCFLRFVMRRLHVSLTKAIHQSVRLEKRFDKWDRRTKNFENPWSGLDDRWPPWSFTNPIWHSDARACINQLFCHCGFDSFDFHWQLVSFAPWLSVLFLFNSERFDVYETIISLNLDRTQVPFFPSRPGIEHSLPALAALAQSNRSKTFKFQVHSSLQC